MLIGAVLGSYFLAERLGTLGKLGCAICLIGSVIIVLHAPPDPEIKTIDVILHFAIQPGSYGLASGSVLLLTCLRILVLLYCRGRICSGHDLQSCAKIRQEKSVGLSFNMLNSRFSFGDVCKGIRHSRETNLRWHESIQTPFDLCFYYIDHNLYFDADELLQQSFVPISNLDVSHPEPRQDRLTVRTVSIHCTTLLSQLLRYVLPSFFTVASTPPMQ